MEQNREYRNKFMNIWSQPNYDKVAKNIKWRQDNVPINGVGNPRQPYAKRWSYTQLLHQTQRWTQNKLQTWIPETIKLEVNIERKVLDSGLDNELFGFDAKSKDNRHKNMMM